MALTVTAFQTTNWTTTTTPLTISVTGALAGDKIVVIYGGDNGTGSGPVTAATASTTGGSTGAWTEPEEGLATSNQAWVSSSQADVTADGTVTVSLARTQAAGLLWGGMALLLHGHGGLGNHARSAPSAAETVSLTVSEGSAVALLAVDWDALAVVAFSPAGATQVERSQRGAGPDVTNYAGYWLNQAAGTRGYGIGTSSTTNLHIIAIEVLGDASGAVSAIDPQDTFLPGATLLAQDESGIEPLGFMYQPTPEQVLDPVAPPAPPGLAPQTPNRDRRIWRFRSRSAQPIPLQFDVPQVAIRNARPMLRRDASRTAGPVPDQVAPPATPLVPGITTHRPRWLRRRSESAQPVPTQDVAPVNPPLVLLARAHRILFGRRLSDATDPPLEQPTPPAQAHPRHAAPRLRTSSTAAPAADQPTVSAPLERRRIVVRRRSGRAATPTPTQQAAPQNPELVLLNRERVRRLVRRGVGRSAMPTPAQQAAPSNPEIVSAVRALRRKIIRRGPGRTAAPVPAQAAPVTPAFVPSTLRRPRRILRRVSRTASPPPEQQAPVQTSPSPLRRLLRRARRRIAQVFPFVAPPVGRFIEVVITTGSDRYKITTGTDRYSITSGSDRYKINTGSDRYQAGSGGDRYSVEV